MTEENKQMWIEQTITMINKLFYGIFERSG
jgi:hypothetical protein